MFGSRERVSDQNIVLVVECSVEFQVPWGENVNKYNYKFQNIEFVINHNGRNQIVLLQYINAKEVIYKYT